MKEVPYLCSFNNKWLKGIRFSHRVSEENHLSAEPQALVTDSPDVRHKDQVHHSRKKTIAEVDFLKSGIGSALDLKLIHWPSVDKMHISFSAEDEENQLSADCRITAKTIDARSMQNTPIYLQINGVPGLLDIRNIYYMHGSEQLCCIHTEEKNYRMYKGITSLLADISSSMFLRINMHYAININHIYAVGQNGLYLHTGHEIVSIPVEDMEDARQLGAHPFDQVECIFAHLLANVDPGHFEWLESLEKTIQKLMKRRLLTINNLAAGMQLSSRQLLRRFKQCAGMNPNFLAKELRFLTACRLMRQNGRKTIKDIAREVGYTDMGYFKREFIERFGCMPEKLL